LMETDWNPSAAPGHDKLPPLEGLFHALAHEGRSVLMVSDDEALLDACGQSVVRKLRQSPDMEVSVMFDMDREVLLQRFARHVENLSVDEALQSTSAPPTQQVWLQHLHNSTELEQAKLLIRLSTDFPASGVKLLLMANNLCADDLIHHGQAKKLLVWHAPVMRKPVVPVDPSAAKPLAAAASTPPHWLDEAASAVPADFAFGKEAPPVTRTKPGQRWVVQLLLGVFVLVSVVVLGLNQWQSKPDAQEAVAALAADGPQAPAVVEVTEAAPIVLPTVPEPAPSVLPEPVVTAPVAPAPPGLAWARQLQVGGWVVQHVALDTSNDIQTWQAQYPALSRAQTVPLLRPNGQRYWVLVSGPFTTLERANAFAQSPGVPKNHWSRAVTSLQASLDREP
jgi:hypothetical protein